MRAVKASLFIGVSAFSRVLFAQKLVDMYNFNFCLAFSFTVLAVYILDRGFDYGESLKGIIVASSLFIISSLLSQGFFVPLIAIGVGYMYSRGIRGFKLKKGYGIKNFVAAITWGTIISFYSKLDMFVVIFFTTKSFIIAILNDFKDVDDDLKNRIKTFPIILGRKTIYMLLFIHLIFHYAIFGFLPALVFIFSFVSGLVAITKIIPKLAQTEFIVQLFLIELSSS